ncbi:hypothetical protein MML48_2g00006960 [Holotrichia oblita]|uniref:Uncharacterized protein n=1 Tax=Holotrichia oblita TaxID=644536 RepID=A0ACB9TIX6_HOLOL|nr:hypothetical protein MML48_2g00006960 [Holotrichia oblita]
MEKERMSRIMHKNHPKPMTYENKEKGFEIKKDNSDEETVNQRRSSKPYLPARNEGNKALCFAYSANRNPVTGDGVVSWDCRPEKRSSRIYTERNPVTGEFYTIVSPSSTPTKIITNGVTLHNGNSTPIAPIKKEVQAVITNGNATNGEA